MSDCKKHGRKRIICSRCNKDKLNFGFGMCSGCVRRTKRETKPSFYLGTCFSEMLRRVKFFDPLRKKYLGKRICTKEEFFNKFLNDSNFLRLFKAWGESGYQRCYSPSIDRINNDGDYLIENLQFLRHDENTGKDSGLNQKIEPLKIIDSNGIIYKSLTECAKINGLSKSNLRKYIELDKELYGKKYKKL